MTISEFDEKEIARARELVKQAAAIVRRNKISDRAVEFLRLADSNISHPGPMMWHDLKNDRKSGTYSHPDGHEIDHGNLFFTLDEMSELCSKSRTYIRTIANEGCMEQQHRGLYNMRDFMQAVQFYYLSGGKDE